MNQQKENVNFDVFSPTDYRYSAEELKAYLAEEAFIKYEGLQKCL